MSGAVIGRRSVDIAWGKLVPYEDRRRRVLASYPSEFGKAFDVQEMGGGLRALAIRSKLGEIGQGKAES